jgi:hypothetical protein
VTVEQLEHALSTPDGSSDAEIAQHLSSMQLSERLNTARLATLQATLRGKKAREALVALADESAFLAPPSGEIPSTAPPDLATQRLIMLRTIDYVQKTISKLPDLFASRTMVQYHESPPKPLQTWKTAAVDQSLHLDKTSNALMLFRDGKEVVKEETTKGKPLKLEEATMNTIGTFGPLLATVLVGATSAGSALRWSLNDPTRQLQSAGILVRGLGAVCPVTLSRVYMQICTVLEANVNRVETWTVRLWREAESVAIRDLVRDGDQSTLQTARVFKLEVFASCEPGDALWNIAVHAIQCSHSRHLGSEQRRREQAQAIERLHRTIVTLAVRNLDRMRVDPLL